MRIAIVGGGLAGALLALRLRQTGRRIVVDLYAGDRPRGADATGASGGIVRGFVTGAEACRLATASLVELHRSATLRQWAGYREVGSAYLLRPGTDPGPSVDAVNRSLPGAAEVRPAGGSPFRDLPAGTLAVVERRAGFISPARLRDAVLRWLTATGSRIAPVPVAEVSPLPSVRLATGRTLLYDAVVVAAGPWTPRLLAASDLADPDLRTKQIQYSIVRTGPALGAFHDDTTGLYGRPAGDGEFLLGLPADRWDVDPAAVTADPALPDAVVACARRRLGVDGGAVVRTVVSADCYHDRPGLALRPVLPWAPLYTFTGGSGGAAKSALAASREAAQDLMLAPEPSLIGAT